MNATLKWLRSLAPSSRDSAMREPSAPTITVDQRPPIQPEPRPRDTLADLRHQRRIAQATVDEIDLLIDGVMEERRMRGVQS
jgi:hypothetical protein